jgi:hypothetical protein
MKKTENTIATYSSLTFIGLLIAILLEPILGSYIMLGGLSLLSLQVFIWELKHVKDNRRRIAC